METDSQFTLTRFAPWTEDFSFKSPMEQDRLVILNPEDVLWMSPVVARSRRTLEEHITYIREQGIKKALVIAEDIGFLRQCPTLEEVQVIPAWSAVDFDYSPLYDMPNLKRVNCQTMYGPKENKVAYVDYRRIPKLEEAVVSGKAGHCLEGMAGLRKLSLGQGQPGKKTLDGTVDVSALEELDLCQTPLCSLKGLEQAKALQKLSLSYNRSLEDISALAELPLKTLEIEACGKIRDFSVLETLTELEELRLLGSNGIDDLGFLRKMPNLRELHITMNVLDGDLSWCEHIPYVRCKNRKHYNRKDSQLPKG